MIPLRVEARLGRAIVNPAQPIALDALLTAAVAIRDDLPAPIGPDDLLPIDLPLARSKCGRYWLASFSEQVVEDRELAYVVRRPLISELIDFAPRVKSTHISAGANKGYRIPIEIGHVERDTFTWWCIGDPQGVRALLSLIHHLGKRRAVGRGRVAEWRVEPCEPWGDGFPVLRDGAPLRSLPLDYEGVTDGAVTLASLTPPYWMAALHEEVYTP